MMTILIPQLHLREKHQTAVFVRERYGYPVLVSLLEAFLSFRNGNIYR